MLLTVGRSGGASVGPAAGKLKKSGVTIFCVGIGSVVSLPQLQDMASKPVAQHVILPNNLSELHVDPLPKRTCYRKCDDCNFNLHSGCSGGAS